MGPERTEIAKGVLQDGEEMRRQKIIWCTNEELPPEPVEYIPGANGQPPVPRAIIPTENIPEHAPTERVNEVRPRTHKKSASGRANSGPNEDAVRNAYRRRSEGAQESFSYDKR
jgi:hypothetical protein